MKKSTIGFVFLLTIGIGGILIWRYVRPLLFELQVVSTSDSVDVDTLRIGGDNFLGYWFFTSPEMRSQAARKGIGIDFHNDGGAFAERLAKFAEGDYDCIVLPVNTYIQHGWSKKYPGVIVAAISESRGADGIVGFSDRLPSGKINDLNDPSLRFVYTPDSPSSFLLDLTIADFDLHRLRNSDQWRLEVNGSTAVAEKAKQGEGDVFVLWEPDLSKALALPGMKYIWGSDKFSGYIVDVMVFHRDYVKNHGPTLRKFLDLYFRVLSIYANNQEKMSAEMARSTDLKPKLIGDLVKKIEWYDLSENAALQFGIPTRPDKPAQEGLINTIIACTDVLIRSGQMDRDPLEGNPYRITNSAFLEDLSKNTALAMDSGGGQKRNFELLEPRGWADLEEVGTFRVEPITFQSWNNLLADEGKAKVDKIAGLLVNNYPGYRFIIRGHTGPGGDERLNQQLSLERAQVVKQYLLAVFLIQENRMRAEGVGSEKPPPKKPGESPRAYRYRLPRVEFIAVKGNRL